MIPFEMEGVLVAFHIHFFLLSTVVEQLSQEFKHFIMQGSFLTRKIKTSKQLREAPETDQIQLLLLKSKRGKLQRRQTLRPDHLPGESRGAWKRFRPESFGKDTLQPPGLPACWAMWSRFPSFPKLSPMLGQALVLHLSLSHFCSWM